MSDDNSLESRVCQLVADQLRQPLDKVTTEAHLIDDLDADSLDIVDLTIAVEEEFSTDDIPARDPGGRCGRDPYGPGRGRLPHERRNHVVMPLRRIKASAGAALSTNASTLASEAIRLPAGERALNRQTTSATALIVAEGEVAVGTLDDNATLAPGEGVLLEANSPYSLIAESDSLALLFSVSTEPTA